MQLVTLGKRAVVSNPAHVLRMVCAVSLSAGVATAAQVPVAIRSPVTRIVRFKR